MGRPKTRVKYFQILYKLNLDKCILYTGRIYNVVIYIDSYNLLEDVLWTRATSELYIWISFWCKTH